MSAEGRRMLADAIFGFLVLAVIVSWSWMLAQLLTGWIADLIIEGVIP
jgi:hypothetical protein